LSAKLDRLTRSVRDLADLLERFERRGVALVSVSESLDTGTAAGRSVLNVMMSVAQWEREAIGERTREALRHKIANGQRIADAQRKRWAAVKADKATADEAAAATAKPVVRRSRKQR
jgi:DNA invertase Pin-like site-specific DNA recombinase